VPQTALIELRVDAAPGELDAVAAQARILGDWFPGFCGGLQGNGAAEFRFKTRPGEISSVSTPAVYWSNRQDDLKLRAARAAR
jgi:hypothetical protein